MSPIKDPDRLLQDEDINRLRAVVFRDVVGVGLHALCDCAEDSEIIWDIFQFTDETPRLLILTQMLNQD